MMWLYAPAYRPPTYGSVPSGYFLIERGSVVDAAPLRTDLPIGKHAFGVVAYKRELTKDEVDDFQLFPLGTKDGGNE